MPGSYLVHCCTHLSSLTCGIIRGRSPPMRLTPEQVNTLIAYLQRWKTPNCSICRQNRWIVSDTVFELREHVGSTLGGYANTVLSAAAVQIFPVVPITCQV